MFPPFSRPAFTTPARYQHQILLAVAAGLPAGMEKTIGFIVGPPLWEFTVIVLSGYI
jgi:hypothetical protein